MHKVILSNRIIKSERYLFKPKVFFILIILTIIQQMPVIKDVYYNQIRLLLYLCFGIFSFFSIIDFAELLKHKIIKYFLICIVYFTLLSVVATISKTQFRISDIFELLVPFGILLCSLKTSFNEKQLENIISVYVLLSAILGISSIFYYGEGFLITKNYFLQGKNQIGPLCGISAVITAYRIFNTNNTQYNRIKNMFYLLYNLILLFSLIASIIVIRNRSGLTAIAIIIILLILKEFRIKFTLKNIIITYFLLLMIIVLIVMGLLGVVFQAIKDAYVLNYDITDLNSISAGRVIVYKSAITYIYTNSVFGEFGAINKFYGVPHNYILNKWVRYGIVGSLPLVSFYCFLWYFVFVGLKRSYRALKINRLPLWLLLFSLIVSLFEYTYPFGPGVSQIMLWFLLGQYLRRNQE